MTRTSKPGLEDSRESVGEAAEDVIRSIAPWSISILVHAGLLLIAMFVAFTAGSANLKDDDGGGGPVSFDPRNAFQKSLTLRPSSGEDQQNQASDVRPRPAPLTSNDHRNSAMGNSEGLGPSHAGVAKGPGASHGKNGFGPSGLEGGGYDGKRGPWGLDYSTNIGSNFFGIKGFKQNSNAGVKVAFVIDASGSLIDTLPFVIIELKRSIGVLRENDRFTAIFFQNESAIELPPYGLKYATNQTKTQAKDWLDPEKGNIIPMGGTNPLKAIRLALAYKPDLIFLLSDNITGRGKLELDRRMLLTSIREANRSRTRIDTIQFIYPDPLAVDGQPSTMEMISRENNGKPVFLSARDLDLR